MVNKFILWERVIILDTKKSTPMGGGGAWELYLCGKTVQIEFVPKKFLRYFAKEIVAF